MSRVKSPWRTVEGSDEPVEQLIVKPGKRGHFDGVLEARERGLARQIVVGDGTVAEQLEDRIASQHVVIVLVGVVGEDAVDSHTNHFQIGMLDIARIPPIDECFGELFCESEHFVELSEWKQSGVAGNLFFRWHYHNLLGCAKIKFKLKSSLRNHCVPPCLRVSVFSTTT